MSSKKENHQVVKRQVRHREKRLMVSSNGDPDVMPQKELTMGKVCRRSWGPGTIKKSE